VGGEGEEGGEGGEERHHSNGIVFGSKEV
jgi:hypothetical protein